jgi:hypothetical protein
MSCELNAALVAKGLPHRRKSGCRREFPHLKPSDPDTPRTDSSASPALSEKRWTISGAGRIQQTDENIGASMR